MMKWNAKSRDKHYITSESGYKISYALVDNKKIYGAWTPKPNANIYNPPRPEGKYMEALVYTDDINQARYTCDLHHAKEKGLPDPEPYQVENYPAEPDEVKVSEEKNIVVMEPPTRKNKPDPEKEVRQSSCETVEDLINKKGYKRERAEHVITARIEKEELQKRTYSCCKVMTEKGFPGWNFSKFDISKLKPKEMKVMLKNANEIKAEIVESSNIIKSKKAINDV